MTQRITHPKSLILSLALVVLVLLSTAPPLIHADHDLCGCDGQCRSGQLCWACPSSGYNCGVTAESACGVVGWPIPSAGECHWTHDQCGCDAQCSAGQLCWQCPSFGYNCGFSGQLACGTSNVTNAGRCPHDMCGCDEQCGNKGVCWTCSSGGWNCGLTDVQACGRSEYPTIRRVGTCKTTPAKHDECGCDGQCALKGGSCWTCLAGGYNCGASAVEACGDDNAAIKAVGACPETPYTYTCTIGSEFAVCCYGVDEYCPTFHGNTCGSIFETMYCDRQLDAGTNSTSNQTKETIATGTCSDPWPLCCRAMGPHPRIPGATMYIGCRTPHKLGDPFTCKGGKYPACCYDLVAGPLNGMAGTQCTGRNTNANGSFACSMQYSIPVCCDSVDYFPEGNGPYTASGCKFATYD